MSDPNQGRLRFTLFTGVTPGGPPGAPWDHPTAVNFNYLDLNHWTGLAKALEAAKFDGIFWADHSSAHDVCRRSTTCPAAVSAGTSSHRCREHHG
jgi:alkanesulfonate monooxygenase SsuD/methylene tetrahydromethanopterin reductase-like flavin-dependent oxidoreductase (luciferase family)